MRRGFAADVFARVLARLEAGDSVPVAAETENLTVDQMNGRLRKLGMTGIARPQPQPMTAHELDRLLNPHDPPLTQKMLDYAAAYDAHLCDPEDPRKFVAWRHHYSNPGRRVTVKFADSGIIFTAHLNASHIFYTNNCAV